MFWGVALDRDNLEERKLNHQLIYFPRKIDIDFEVKLEFMNMPHIYKPMYLFLPAQNKFEHLT